MNVKVSGTKATVEIPKRLDSVRYPVHKKGDQKEEHYHVNIWKLFKRAKKKG